MNNACWILALTAGLAAASTVPASQPSRDPRDVRNGLVIPDEGYCDQPYVVVRPDGAWVCTMTTGKGREGQRGQHVVATISEDRGRSWSPPVDIEPADGPEASWAVPLITPAGRIYVFYDYNGDRIDRLGEKQGIRADMLGWYVFKYSDDGGRTWSARRYRLPVRLTACDRANDWQGRVQIFWGICKPIVVGRAVYFSFTKLGRYMLENGEGWLFRSDNLLTEHHPERIDWTMLPEGEHGIRAPEFGSVQEEHNIVALANGDLYCIYRTTTGFACHTYSRDGGRTWTRPVHATYRPGGPRIKHPRACPRIWRTSEGRYLLWYHNHGGRDFEGRNPAWIAGGIERDGHIWWSQPEILLYDPDPKTRTSYPDLIEQDGRFWITETQKEIARVHEVDASLLRGTWDQLAGRPVPTPRPVLRWTPEGGARIPMPRLPALHHGGGFAIELRLRFDRIEPGQVILDSRDDAGRGVALQTTPAGTLAIELSDGRTHSSWDCDPGLLVAGRTHHVTVIVDGGPRIITFVVDGRLCDGGESRPCGWGRFSEALEEVNGSAPLRVAPSLKGRVELLRLYDRYLRTSEAVSLAAANGG